MKNLITAMLVLLSVTLYAQDTTSIAKVKQPKEPKNIFIISGGVWERDYETSTWTPNHAFGPMFALEYQRVFNDYVSFRAEFFGGGIYYNNQYKDAIRNIGISAGILVTPFGKKFRYLKLGVSPMVVNYSTAFFNPYICQNVHRERYYFGFEFPIRFNVVDNNKWMLGVGFDIQTAFYEYGFGLLTTQCMVHFGYKF